MKTKFIHTVGHLLSIIAIIGILNVLPAILQGWAWTTMLYDRLPDQGIELALDTTFSGNAPCEKCLAISKFKREKEETTSPAPSNKELKIKTTQLPNKSSFYHPPAPARMSYASFCQLLPPPPFLPIHGPPPQSV